MSVNSHLTSTASNLVLSPTEKESIVVSIDNLSTKLQSSFRTEITQKFQFGSSTRGTILPRRFDSRSDIDYMVVFSSVNGEFKPQTYLDKLKRFVDAKYTRSEIKQSHPTIVLELNHISFELVPAIYDVGYRIPAPSSNYSDWIYTDPTGIKTDLERANVRNESFIKPLVRLIKYWNANMYCFSVNRTKLNCF